MVCQVQTSTISLTWANQIFKFLSKEFFKGRSFWSLRKTLSIRDCIHAGPTFQGRYSSLLPGHQQYSNQLLIDVNLKMESYVASKMCAQHVYSNNGFSAKSKIALNTNNRKSLP